MMAKISAVLDRMESRKWNTENSEPESEEWLLSQKLLLVDYAKKIVPGFRFDEDNRQVIKDLFNYFLNITGALDLRKGIWLEGDIGTGKSTLMQVFSKFMIARMKGFKIHICSHVSNQYTMKGDVDLYTYNEYGFSRVPVEMCFDELGRESIPANYFGQKLNVMQHILHIRYALWQTEGLRTFVTTNLGAEDVEELYGDYIRDRRKEMFNIITLTGKSRR